MRRVAHLQSLGELWYVDGSKPGTVQYVYRVVGESDTREALALILEGRRAERKRAMVATDGGEGELLMRRLRTLDKIAYVRFASVYRDFQDVEAFLVELKDLLQRRS